MEIIIAENSGVCFGVRRALALLRQAWEESKKENKRVVMLGPLIHNPRLIEELKEKGVLAVDQNSVPPNSKVVIRSHGITESVEKLLENNKEISLVDATCPYVKRIHRLVKKRSREGFSILIMGDETHSEVEGITSRIFGNFFIIHPLSFSLKEPQLVDFINKNHKIFAVAQTTSRPSSYEFLQKKTVKLAKDIPDFVFKADKTICTATLKRQDSAAELSKRTDAVIVIGGKNSSNTSKLFQVVSERNKNAFWVESPKDFSAQELDFLKQLKTIGITAGASTPDEQILEMKNFMVSLNV